VEYARILVIGGVFLIVGTIAVVVLKSSTEPPPRLEVSLGEGQDFRLSDGLRVWSSMKNDQTWTMHARDAVYSRSEEMLHLTDVNIEMPRDGRGPVQVRGARASFDISNDTFVLSDGVNMSIDDMVATVQSVHYDMNTRMITSLDPVRAYNDRMVMTGTGFNANLDEKQMTINRDVHVQFRVPRDAVEASGFLEGGLP